MVGYQERTVEVHRVVCLSTWFNVAVAMDFTAIKEYAPDS